MISTFPRLQMAKAMNITTWHPPTTPLLCSSHLHPVLETPVLETALETTRTWPSAIMSQLEKLFQPFEGLWVGRVRMLFATYTFRLTFAPGR